MLLASIKFHTWQRADSFSFGNCTDQYLLYEFLGIRLAASVLVNCTQAQLDFRHTLRPSLFSGQWSNAVEWVERRHIQVLFSNSRLAPILLPCCELTYINFFFFLMAINSVTIATSIAIGMIFPSFSHSNKNMFFCKRVSFTSSCVTVAAPDALSVLNTVRSSKIMPVLLSQHDKHTDLLQRRHLCDYLGPCPRVLYFVSLREKGHMHVSFYTYPRGELSPTFLTSSTTELFNLKLISDLCCIST